MSGIRHDDLYADPDWPSLLTCGALGATLPNSEQSRAFFFRVLQGFFIYSLQTPAKSGTRLEK